MKEINYIVQNVSPTSLIIIDELGRGKSLIHRSQMKIFNKSFVSSISLGSEQGRG